MARFWSGKRRKFPVEKGQHRCPHMARGSRVRPFLPHSPSELAARGGYGSAGLCPRQLRHAVYHFEPFMIHFAMSSRVPQSPMVPRMKPMLTVCFGFQSRDMANGRHSRRRRGALRSGPLRAPLCRKLKHKLMQWVNSIHSFAFSDGTPAKDAVLRVRQTPQLHQMEFVLDDAMHPISARNFASIHHGNRETRRIWQCLRPEATFWFDLLDADNVFR